MLEIEKRIARIREKMALAAQRVGRDPKDILLCAACKAQTSETVKISAGLGLDLFGENRAQEMAQHLRDGAYLGKPCHFIGHLQTNKVRQVVGHAGLIQSVDRLNLMEALEREAKNRGLIQDILLEMNLGNEESKAGAREQDLPLLLEHLANFPHLRLKGLMAIPPVTEHEGEARRYFARLRQLLEGIQAQGDHRAPATILSMGMSGSYEAAILEGATLVRVGREIYGERR